jgi:hypothetical protein
MTFIRAVSRSSLSRGIRIALVAVLLSAAAGCVYRTPAQPHLWQLRGAIIVVQKSSLEVRDKSGQVIALTLDDETAYAMHRQPVSLDQVQVGRRVMVDVLRARGVDRAVLVQIF